MRQHKQIDRRGCSSWSVHRLICLISKQWRNNKNTTICCWRPWRFEGGRKRVLLLPFLIAHHYVSLLAWSVVVSAQSQYYSQRSSEGQLSKIVASLHINLRPGKDFQWKLSLPWLLYLALCNIKSLKSFTFPLKLVFVAARWVNTNHCT